jgi:ferredoxin/flavodoxin---NADP+ reductase
MNNPPNENVKEVKVQWNEKIAPNTYLLAFDRFFDFIPGQVVNVQIDRNIPPRMYSIASSNQDKLLKLLYKINPEGSLTPKLARLKKDNVILISEPFGKFTPTTEKSICIATGTGIAPFVSMFFSGWMENKILIHGSRIPEEFYFQKEFNKQLQEKYIQCCSREKSENSFHGRVTDYLYNWKDIPVELKYYLCGSAEMVVEVRDLLLLKGIPYDHILSEIYF